MCWVLVVKSLDGFVLGMDEVVAMNEILQWDMDVRVAR
jgi:hypothetical protein